MKFLNVFFILIMTKVSFAKENFITQSPLQISPMSTPVVESVEAPINGEVCFSPDEKCDQKLLALIKTAKKNIDIAIYDITLINLVEELVLISKTVSVRFIVDKGRVKENKRYSLVPRLINEKIPLKYGKNTGKMHNKFMIVDGIIVETGSFNYSSSAASKNHENQIYLSKPEIIKRYSERFEILWQQGEKVDGK